MQIIYASQPLPDTILATIFLAGPTPRDPVVASWRPQAIAILQELGFDGAVLVPEPEDGQWRHDYDGQLEWELRMRRAADIIVFWVPRDVDTMPAFTTNVEFGAEYESGKVLYGRPNDAPKNRYLDHLWRRGFGEDPYADLRDLMSAVLDKLGKGARRQGGECIVPLFIWQQISFQRWYESLRRAGNRLDGFRSLLTVPARPAGGSPFIWAAHATVWVEAEQRHKANEIVIARPDLSVVVPIHRPGAAEARVVLVSEFRTPVRNNLGLVIEPPGGSSKAAKSERLVALEELAEETGFTLDNIERLVPIGDRQLAATLASHHAHVFALEVSDEEMARIEAHGAAGIILGVDEEERTSVIIQPLATLGDQPLDWSALGMVMAAERALAGSGRY